MTMISICGGVVALVTVVAWFMPVLSRPDLYFATTVRPWLRTTPEGRRILWRYRLQVIVHSLVAAGLLLVPGRLAGDSAATWLITSMAAIAWQIAGWFFAFQGARRQVKPHGVDPASVREAEAEGETVNLPGGWLLQVGPFVTLAAAALDLHRRWTSLPERFPVHWGVDGRPNGWASRTAAGVYGPLVIAAVIAASIAVFAALLRRSHPIHHAGEPAEAERRFRRVVLWTLLGAEYYLVLVTIWVARLPLAAASSGGSPAPPPVAPLLGLTLAFVVVTAVALVRAAQGRERVGHGAGRQQGEPPIGDRTPDRCWKAGLFYVNPDDPALFVEKRFGIGYTLNFGRPLSWLILVLSIVAPLAVALWVVRGAS